MFPFVLFYLKLVWTHSRSMFYNIIYLFIHYIYYRVTTKLETWKIMTFRDQIYHLSRLKNIINIVTVNGKIGHDKCAGKQMAHVTVMLLAWWSQVEKGTNHDFFMTFCELAKIMFFSWQLMLALKSWLVMFVVGNTYLVLVRFLMWEKRLTNYW